MDTRIELSLEQTGDGGTGTWLQDRGTPERTLAPPVVVTLTGPLSVTSAHALVERLCALLRRHGAVVADVSGIELTHSGAVHAFAEAAERAGEWPDVRLALATTDRTTVTLLVSSRVAERVPVYPDVATALAHVDDRPDLVRGWWRFGIDARAPGDARQHVRRVCESWAVDDDTREGAEIVVTELVTNAVEHAVSASVVEVERRAHSLRLTVRDFDLAPLPEARLPEPTSPRGRGLAMVAAVSTAWGVESHRDGKTVWAEMTTV